MKVITVTLNPAIDKTIYCADFKLGETNRSDYMIEDIAGKGINVSNNLAMLNYESEIVGVFGGHQGQRSIDDCRKSGFTVHSIMAKGETRVNQKIVDKNGLTTELNEKGPEVNAEEIKNCLELITSLSDKNTFFVLAGSVAPGFNRDIYYQMIEIIKKQGAKVMLDTSGDLLTEAIQALPTCLKPNIDECQSLLGLDRKPTLQELVELSKDLVSKGIELIVISLGKDGALFTSEEGCYKAEALPLVSKSTTGAGDAMVGSLTYSYVNKESMDILIRRAIACSGAAIETEGTKPGSKERVLELMNKVKIKKVEENIL